MENFKKIYEISQNYVTYAVGAALLTLVLLFEQPPVIRLMLIVLGAGLVLIATIPMAVTYAQVKWAELSKKSKNAKK